MNERSFVTKIVYIILKVIREITLFIQINEKWIQS